MSKIKYSRQLFIFLAIPFVLITIEGCHLSRKQIVKTANYYRDNYGTIKTQKDTIITIKKLTFVYSKGELKEVGKMGNGKKKGKWFLFGKSLTLEYVLKYRNGNIIDTLREPFILINDSW